MANRLLVEKLSAGYGSVTVLRDVCLEVREAEFVALLGTNGNGKTTLLNAILGLVPRISGSIKLEWDGGSIELTRMRSDEIAGAGVGLVPEGRRLFAHLTVEENLILGGSSARVGRRMPRNLSFVYDTFPLLRERRGQTAGKMSGGQQQLLAIGRALMMEPRILLVDEPSVGLAPIAVDQVLSAIAKLQAENRLTVMMAEQSIVQAIRLASRSYLISHGQITEEMDRNRAMSSEDDIRNALLGING